MELINYEGLILIITILYLLILFMHVACESQNLNIELHCNVWTTCV